MNELKHRLCWRNKKTGEVGHCQSQVRRNAEANLSTHLGSCSAADYEYWVEPVGELKPPEVQEPKWLVRWRGKISSSTFYICTPKTFADAEATASRMNSSNHFSDHWFQPEGTEPALKDGCKAIRWRMHWQFKNDASLSGKAVGTFAKREDAQAAIDSGVCISTQYDYWVQPEPDEEVKVEPPKPQLWQMWIEDRTCVPIEMRKANRPPEDLESARDAASRFNFGQTTYPARRYFILPAEEPVKPEPLYCFAGASSVFSMALDCLTHAQATAYVGAFRLLWPTAVTSVVRMADPVPPKPYERRWTFHAITVNQSGIFQHRVYFRLDDGTTCKVCSCQTFDQAVDQVKYYWMALDPEKADREIDSIYEGQK